jgi:hypothetical protein
MKSKEEIEQLAEKAYPIKKDLYRDLWNENNAYVKGYTQCQEDIQPLLKELFNVWEALAECGEIHIDIDFNKKYEELKSKINKQD